MADMVNHMAKLRPSYNYIVNHMAHMVNHMAKLRPAYNYMFSEG